MVIVIVVLEDIKYKRDLLEPLHLLSLDSLIQYNTLYLGRELTSSFFVSVREMWISCLR